MNGGTLSQLRDRLGEVLLRDPGYISLSVRWLGWLVGLATVLLQAAPRENLQAAVPALALAAGQLLLLSLNPGWLRFEVGKERATRGALLRPAADLAIAMTCLYLTGGWNSPLYLFAVSAVLAPSLRYGLGGALLATVAFSGGFWLTIWATPLGLAPAFLADGQPGPDLVSSAANPLVIALFAAFLGELLQRLQAERARAEALIAAHERARLARDIHDGVAQTLFMLTMSLESGRLMAQKETAEKTARHLDSLVPIARKALLELRNAMHNVEPLAAGEQTLAEAVRSLLRDYSSAVGCRLELQEEPDFEPPDGHSSALFPMIQEALSNACHHAEAARITVRLSGRLAEILDDGKGIDWASVQPGRGLDSLKSRAQDNGMTLSIEPAGAVGTRVRITW